MRKIVLSGLIALNLSMGLSGTAHAEEPSGEPFSFTAQAQEVSGDIESVVGILKTGTMGESYEGKRSFSELGTDSMALGQGILEAAQAQRAAGVFGYTDEDLYILAHVICGEAQSCPDDEQLYVGSVVLNRVNHPAFPNSLKGVVFQGGQYACTRDGNYYRDPTPQNWANAKYLLDNGSILPGNVVWQSGSRQGSGLYLRTRYHSYCY